VSYEDSFEQDADDERAYRFLEHGYLYKNSRPQNIGKWEWILMFGMVPTHSVYSEAMRDAREMALELGRSVVVHSTSPGYFSACPDDYYELRGEFREFTYTAKRHEFIKALVIEGRYPDLVKIAHERNSPSRHAIYNYFMTEEAARHKSLRARDAAQQGQALKRD